LIRFSVNGVIISVKWRIQVVYKYLIFFCSPAYSLLNNSVTFNLRLKFQNQNAMNGIKIVFLFIPIVLLNCRTSEQMAKIDTTTVKNVDINQYIGKWYEIARFPHSFEKNLVGVTATYTLREDGKINVLNQGFKKTLDGPLKQARGKAKIPDSGEPGKLKVSFFLFFYADYYILELDEDNYQYALVGSSSDKYLWILGRTPVMPEETYKMLIAKARERGYDTSKLIAVEQNTAQ
jgi:apolipoprotein D and lipocalin family protein